MSRRLSIGLIVVAMDQATKWWVSRAIAPGEVRVVLPALLQFTHVYNPGAAFGLFPAQLWLFIAAAAAVGLYAWMRRDQIRQQPFLMQLGVVLGLAGAFGNTVDRVWRGAVLDFIDILVIPVFNVADMAITIGVAFMMWTVTFRQPTEGDEVWKN